MDLAIIRSQVGDSIHYEFTQAVPQDLMDMLKAELGENPSPEAIKEALGPFGSMPTEYSKVLQKEGVWHEWHYKDEGTGVELVAYVIADSDFTILERRSHSGGSEISAEITNYTADGKVLSRSIGEETYENTFDGAGNVISEMTTDFSRFEYSYDNAGRVIQKIEYMGDDVLSVSLTNY